MSKKSSNQNGNCSDHIKNELSLSAACDDCGEAAVFPQIPSDSFDATDGFGEPYILPRIGDEYQAELPPYVGESSSKSCLRNCTDTAVRSHPLRNFLIGSPLPLTWTNGQKIKSAETNSDSKNVKEMGTHSNGGINISCCSDGVLVPGLLGESWGNAEKASFLLGLYIFEKNFVEVSRFIGTKNMGAILSYYYGKFYGSDEYKRWSERHKTKSKKCVYGQRIFSGLRLQELLSRIFAKVSEECKSSLLEVSKKFGDEKMSLAEFVSLVRAMAGMNVLVEAVGIGTGKQDLTGMALEPSRSSQAIAVRPEIPTGKACSSLTTAEIVKFLNGDYRLSKARSNDLFWEAVWPRLLARGWHSEQPKNKEHLVGSSPCLVFLVPGVKKFGRKLIKGDHYYDSVSDVLNKVARESELIELESDKPGGDKNNQEHDLTGERKLGEDKTDDLPARQQRHSYLQPRTPNRSAVAIKFTVVDTSLAGGRIRELRMLPSEVSNALVPLDRAGDNDEDTTEENAGESDTINASCQDIGKSSIPDLKRKKMDLNDNKQCRKVVKSQSKRKQKEGNREPLSKRCQRSTANNHEETRDGSSRSSMAPRSENGTSSCCTGIHESHQDLSSQVSSLQDKLSSTSSSKGSPDESIGHFRIDKSHAAESASVNCQTQPLFDLNLPRLPPNSENSVLAADMGKQKGNKSSQNLPKSSNVEARTQQQPNLIPLRHSTRIRPPTTRALEAVADGYLTASPRRRSKDRNTGSHEDLNPRPSQRARVSAGPSESNNSSTASQHEETENGASTSGNYNLGSRVHVLPSADTESAS